MTGFANNGDEIFSSITIGSIEDIGYAVVRKFDSGFVVT